jgi:hypothetical protein
MNAAKTDLSIGVNPMDFSFHRRIGRRPSLTAAGVMPD